MSSIKDVVDKLKEQNAAADNPTVTEAFRVAADIEAGEVTTAKLTEVVKEVGKIRKEYLRLMASTFEGFPVILNEHQKQDVVLMVNREMYDALREIYKPVFECKESVGNLIEKSVADERRRCRQIALDRAAKLRQLKEQWLAHGDTASAVADQEAIDIAEIIAKSIGE